MLAVHRREELLVGRQAFGGAQEETASGPQREVKQRNQLPLEVGSQVDEDVSAGHEVQRGERRVLDQAVHREGAHVSRILVDPESRLLGREEALHALRGHVLADLAGVASDPRRRHEFAVDIRGEDLDDARLLVTQQVLASQDGE